MFPPRDMNLLAVLLMTTSAISEFQVPKSTLPDSVDLKTLVRYDQSALEKFGGSHSNLRVWLDEVIKKVQAVLLRFDVSVKLDVSIEYFDYRIPSEESESRNFLVEHHNQTQEQKLVSYLCDFCFIGGYGGTGMICPTPENPYDHLNLNGIMGMVANSAASVEESAAIWIHEFGHNFGLT